MSISPKAGSFIILVQGNPQPVPPGQVVNVPDLLAHMADYIYQMQATVTILAAVVGVVTIIGALLAYSGARAQDKAQQEVREFRLESKKEMADRHAENAKQIADRYQSHKEEMRLLRQASDDNIKIGLSQLRDNLNVMMDKRVELIEHIFSTEIIQKIENVESAYASSLRRIENILVAFQEECDDTGTVGLLITDFIRYNKFRLCLMRLVSGDRKDTHNGLCLILAEYVPNIEETTAFWLRGLIVELRESGRISRTDLRILAGDVISCLDKRFPPPDDGQGPDQS